MWRQWKALCLLSQFLFLLAVCSNKWKDKGKIAHQAFAPKKIDQYTWGIFKKLVCKKIDWAFHLI